MVVRSLKICCNLRVLVGVHAAVSGTEIGLCDQQKRRVVDAAEIQLAYMRLFLALRSAFVINKNGVVVDAAEIQLAYTRLLLALRSATVINKSGVVVDAAEIRIGKD